MTTSSIEKRLQGRNRLLNFAQQLRGWGTAIIVIGYILGVITIMLAIGIISALYNNHILDAVQALLVGFIFIVLGTLFILAGHFFSLWYYYAGEHLLAMRRIELQLDERE